MIRINAGTLMSKEWRIIGFRYRLNFISCLWAHWTLSLWLYTMVWILKEEKNQIFFNKAIIEVMYKSDVIESRQPQYLCLCFKFRWNIWNAPLTFSLNVRAKKRLLINHWWEFSAVFQFSSETRELISK